MYNEKTLSNDLSLFKIIKKQKPEIILINIAGGKQEILALSIKNKIHFKTICICSGAALSFFSGSGAKISDFIDKHYLGWLMRIFHEPKIFLIRILKSIKLIYLVFNSKHQILYK
jgi:UDP-N-acetyl-D-mannosaminuronic acid transferase (WecB/TagA/CpsF family)